MRKILTFNSEIDKLIPAFSYLFNLIKNHHKPTANHQEEVAYILNLIDNELNINEEEKKKDSIAGYLHDIGKYNVNVEVLNKRGFPTVEDWIYLKDHPELGYQLIKGCYTQDENDETEKIRNDIAERVIGHHIALNGITYPNNFNFSSLENELGSNRLEIVDKFHASLTRREDYDPEREIRYLRKKVDSIKAESGLHKVLDVLESNIDFFCSFINQNNYK